MHIKLLIIFAIICSKCAHFVFPPNMIYFAQHWYCHNLFVAHKLHSQESSLQQCFMFSGNYLLPKQESIEIVGIKTAGTPWCMGLKVF